MGSSSQGEVQLLRGCGEGRTAPGFTTGTAFHGEVELWKCHSAQEILPSLESWVHVSDKKSFHNLSQERLEALIKKQGR